MASGLFDLLSDLAKDPNLLNQFKANPDQVMAQYDITGQNKSLVKSSIKDGKHHDFFKAIGDEAHEQFADPDIAIC